MKWSKFHSIETNNRLKLVLYEINFSYIKSKKIRK